MPWRVWVWSAVMRCSRYGGVGWGGVEMRRVCVREGRMGFPEKGEGVAG